MIELTAAVQTLSSEADSVNKKVTDLEDKIMPLDMAIQRVDSRVDSSFVHDASLMFNRSNILIWTLIVLAGLALLISVFAFFKK